MQVSGRLLILLTLTLALAMSGGAWWYHYQESRRAAEFWGRTDAKLLTTAPTVEFLELGEGQPTAEQGPQVAGRAVSATHDLSGAQGLIHLRYVFADDANFQWDQRRREAIDAGTAWAYALQFADGERQMTILFTRDFKTLGKLDADSLQVEVLPTPRPAAAIQKYLTDVGALAAPTAR